MALAGAGRAIGLGQHVQVAPRHLVAAGQRARHLGVQDQQVRHQPGLHPVAIDPVIGGQGRDLAQDGGPLEVIQSAADLLPLGQQQMVLHVQDPGGVVGPFHRPAQPQEPVGVIAQHGPPRRAVEHQGQLLDPFQEAGEGLAAGASGLERLQLVPGVVQAFPHLGGQGGAHRPAVGPRRGDAGIDRGRVLRIEGQEVAHGALGGGLAAGVEGVGHPGGGDDALPGVGSGLGRRHG